MKVSFGRAVRVDSDTNNPAYWNDARVDDSSFETFNTMRSFSSSIYDKETSKRIGAFLRSVTSDYSPKTGFVLKKIEGDLYLFTGKEAVKARKINYDSKKEAEALDKRYEEGPNENSSPNERVELESKNLQKILKQNISIRRNKELLKMVENGENNKPMSKIDLKLTENPKEIRYFCRNGSALRKESLTI